LIEQWRQPTGLGTLYSAPHTAVLRDTAETSCVGVSSTHGTTAYRISGVVVRIDVATSRLLLTESAQVDVIAARSLGKEEEM
jgi:hypothetical protein